MAQVTNEMMERAKEFFRGTGYEYVYVTSNKMQFAFYYDASFIAKQLPDPTITIITRQQVNEYFEGGNKCAKCSNVADYDSANKAYSELCRECKESEFYKLLNPNIADAVKDDAMFTEQDVQVTATHFADWCEAYYTVVTLGIWKTQGQYDGQHHYTTAELYQFYLTSKEIK